MRLNVIDYAAVQADTEFGLSTKFNTNFHTVAEAPGFPIPTNTPYSFERWLPLILSSRGLSESSVQIVALSRPQVIVLLHASEAAVHTRVLSRSYAEDIEEEVYPAFSKLIFPPGGLFVRTADCSPKDGVQSTPGVMAMHSVEEVILRVTTSLRTWSTFNNFVNNGYSELKFFFLPFDTDMQTEREYRVFCAPDTMQITAISQYRWHKPWLFAKNNAEERQSAAETIMAGARDIHGKILKDIGAHEKDDLARSQGFTFDMLYNEQKETYQLIELNTFGVRSACGSCLFHWLKDQDVLYGVDGDVEFRVTI